MMQRSAEWKRRTKQHQKGKEKRNETKAMNEEPNETGKTNQSQCDPVYDY